MQFLRIVWIPPLIVQLRAICWRGLEFAVLQSAAGSGGAALPNKIPAVLTARIFSLKLLLLLFRTMNPLADAVCRNAAPFCFILGQCEKRYALVASLFCCEFCVANERGTRALLHCYQPHDQTLATGSKNEGMRHGDSNADAVSFLLFVVRNEILKKQDGAFQEFEKSSSPGSQKKKKKKKKRRIFKKHAGWAFFWFSPTRPTFYRSAYRSSEGHRNVCFMCYATFMP